MTEVIRKIEENDFEAVSALYNGRKSIEELKWLFTNPDDSTIYNAFVAVNNNKVIGAIGYSSSIYKQEKIELFGVIFMSWIVASDYKGFAGISLLKKASGIGDFAIAISGSNLGQSFYPMLKYKYISNSDIYFKILNSKGLYNSFKRKTLIKTAGMIGLLLPTYFNNPNKKTLQKDIEFIPYNGNNYVKEKEYKNIFTKKMTKKNIDWLLKCPNLNTSAFCIKNDNDYLGICVLYIQKTKNTIKGRIVHLPFLGFDKEIWVSVIDKCLSFFRKEGCTTASGLAHQKMSHSGFKDAGFKNINGYDKPNYIKDLNGHLESIELSNWHLQFSEGDKGYRGI